jgi:hypothetical protein
VQKYNEFVSPLRLAFFHGRGLRRTAALAAGLLIAASAGGQSYPDVGGTPARHMEDARPAPATPPASTANTSASQSDVRVQDDAPLRYVVKKGDTLWAISKKFLKDPWQWPEVWTTNNTRVTNPHLIYPGEELLLVYKDKKPQIVPSGEMAVENTADKLSPRIRQLPLEQAIPTIPIAAIRQFLKGPRVVTDDELSRAPYVVEFNELHLAGSAGMGAYVKNLARPLRAGYSVVRRGDAYRDPDTGELLGYEAIPTAEGEVRELGKLSTVQLLSSTREVNVGDRLLPQESDLFNANFYPHAPNGAVGGRIISVYDGLSEIGQFQIVTLNRGAKQGLEPGHVLSILQAGGLASDPYAPGKLQLPDEFAGTLLIFKVTPRVSYGLVMEATRAIHVLDKVEKPRAGERT